MRDEATTMAEQRFQCWVVWQLIELCDVGSVVYWMLYQLRRKGMRCYGICGCDVGCGVVESRGGCGCNMNNVEVDAQWCRMWGLSIVLCSAPSTEG